MQYPNYYVEYIYIYSIKNFIIYNTDIISYYFILQYITIHNFIYIFIYYIYVYYKYEC